MKFLHHYLDFLFDSPLDYQKFFVQYWSSIFSLSSHRMDGRRAFVFLVGLIGV